MGQYKSYLTDAQNEGEEGVEAPFVKCQKESRIFLQVDYIRMKGTYPGYKNKKKQRNAFYPSTLDFEFLKNFQVWECLCRAQQTRRGRPR